MGNLLYAEIIRFTPSEYLETPAKLMDLLKIYLAGRQRKDD